MNSQHAIQNGLNKSIKKIVHYDDSNNILNVFISAPEAAIHLDIKSNNICRACRGKCIIYDKNKNKLNFKFLEDGDDIINKKISIENLPIKKTKTERVKVYNEINVYDKDGKLLRICKNKREVIRLYKVKNETILAHCEGRIKYPTDEYKFSYGASKITPIKNEPKQKQKPKTYHKINVYDKNGILLKTCKNKSEAIKLYKVTGKTILAHCEGDVKYSTGEYKFTYAID